MMGGDGGGSTGEANTQSLPALPVCRLRRRPPSERWEKSNYPAPKDLIIGRVSFA